MIKILLLVSSIHVGDMSQADSIIKALSVNNKIERFYIDAGQDAEQAKLEYLKFAKDDSYITLAVGEKGMELFKYLSDEGAIDKKRSYNCLSIHQYFEMFPELELDHIIIPKVTMDDKFQKQNIKYTPIFASLSNNPSKKELQDSYNNWEDLNKPALDGKYIIVMMPGDAPDSHDHMRYFTRESAKELFDDIYKLWVDHGKQHKIIIQNGPRTGKYDSNTGQVRSKHEYCLGQDPSLAIDNISAYFIGLFKEMNYSFFNFAIEVDGKARRVISFYNPLLYLAIQNDNIFILPGGSVSLIGQVPLYLPSNRIILFKPSSMNESHQAIFNSAFKLNYLSYFAPNGEVVMPQKIGKRKEDDAALVAKDILIGYSKKFKLPATKF